MILPAYCGSVTHSDHGPDSRLLADEREAPDHWQSPRFGLTNRMLSSAARIIRLAPRAYPSGLSGIICAAVADR
jgi:hypothetical protein